MLHEKKKARRLKACGLLVDLVSFSGHERLSFDRYGVRSARSDDKLAVFHRKDVTETDNPSLEGYGPEFLVEDGDNFVLVVGMDLERGEELESET